MPQLYDLVEVSATFATNNEDGEDVTLKGTGAVVELRVVDSRGKSGIIPGTYLQPIGRDTYLFFDATHPDDPGTATVVVELDRDPLDPKNINGGFHVHARPDLSLKSFRFRW